MKRTRRTYLISTVRGSRSRFSGIFRSDRFNAKDFVEDRVLPYSNRRFNGTFGGPIIRDRAHYFGFYERESEPSAVTFNSVYRSFNLDQERDLREWNGRARLDFQVWGQDHVMVRGNQWRRTDPAYANFNGATSHPSARIPGQVLISRFSCIEH